MGGKTDHQEGDPDHHFVDPVENVCQERLGLFRGNVDEKTEQYGKEDHRQHLPLGHGLNDVVRNDGHDLVHKGIARGGYVRNRFL